MDVNPGVLIAAYNVLKFKAHLFEIGNNVCNQTEGPHTKLCQAGKTYDKSIVRTTIASDGCTYGALAICPFVILFFAGSFRCPNNGCPDMLQK